MGEQQQWIIDLQSEVDTINSETGVERKKRPCIYRVPTFLRDLNDKAYTPEFISIGPYHHGEVHLNPMEPSKRTVLAKYLKRAGKTLAQVVDAMRPEVRELMDSYESLEERWANEERFLELMVLDGCFLLDLQVWDSLELDDSPFGRVLWQDVYRIENQIPLAVLDILMEIAGNKIEDIQRFIRFYHNYPNRQPKNIREMGCHLLDNKKEDKPPDGGYYHDFNSTVHTVTELVQAGVSIKKITNGNLNDISFSNGVLHLPRFIFNIYTKTMLLNFIAYEQLRREKFKVTCFAFLMYNLIGTAKDVALLRDKGIITCWAGSDDEIASFFTTATTVLRLPRKLLNDKENVNKSLEAYCEKRWHKWRVSFMQTYLSNPWVFISLLAALILLFLTIVQTVYTIMPYYNN